MIFEYSPEYIPDCHGEAWLTRYSMSSPAVKARVINEEDMCGGDVDKLVAVVSEIGQSNDNKHSVFWV